MRGESEKSAKKSVLKEFFDTGWCSGQIRKNQKRKTILKLCPTGYFDFSNYIFFYHFRSRMIATIFFLFDLTKNIQKI